jgi:hypothetical protein
VSAQEWGPSAISHRLYRTARCQRGLVSCNSKLGSPTTAARLRFPEYCEEQTTARNYHTYDLDDLGDALVQLI